MISSHDGMDARRDRPAGPPSWPLPAVSPRLRCHLRAAAAGGASGSAAAAGASPDPADPGSARPA